jgi:hypothetical protein
MAVAIGAIEVVYTEPMLRLMGDPPCMDTLEKVGSFTEREPAVLGGSEPSSVTLEAFREVSDCIGVGEVHTVTDGPYG